FSFDQYRADLLLNAVNYAKTLYFTERDNWDAMVKRAMETDHSWNASAKDYIALYHRVLGD
ncbi:MAG: starch synthase, partial [Clostridia bacterium]|nr:starch synthase [Clostridia bacterium]